jgi:hypothetical protein
MGAHLNGGLQDASAILVLRQLQHVWHQQACQGHAVVIVSVHENALRDIVAKCVLGNCQHVRVRHEACRKGIHLRASKAQLSAACIAHFMESDMLHDFNHAMMAMTTHISNTWAGHPGLHILARRERATCDSPMGAR